VNTDQTDTLNPDAIRALLQSFWSEMLEIAPSSSGLSVAVPLCYPDGWQVLIDIRPSTPGLVRISDSGKTLHWLAGAGQNIEAERIKALLAERADVFHLQRDGWELFRDIRLPLKGMDVQIFAEGLIDIAHLFFLYEPAPKTQNVVRETVERVFSERAIPVQHDLRLDGLLEKKIKVDYFAEIIKPVAIEVISRRGNITSYMEQWGFRWGDIRSMKPELMPAMIFDPAVTEIDDTALSIGTSVCTLFCAYHEADRIHDFLQQASVV